MQIANCKLQIANYKLRMANRGALMESSRTFKDFWWSISDQGKSTSRILLRLMGVSVASFLAAFLLGFGFLIIYFALMFFVIRFFPYSQPAYFVFTKAAGIREAPEKLVKPVVPWYRYIALIIYGFVIFYLIFIGLNLFVENGFCGQNFLCLLLTAES